MLGMKDWLLYGLISRCWGVIEGPVIIWSIWMRPAVCESMVLGVLCWACWRDWLLYGLLSRCRGVIERPVIIWFIWMRQAVCESMVLGA